MRTYFIALLLLLLNVVITGEAVQAQGIPPALPEATIESRTLESHLRFLASDELKGRMTGSPELDIAALYLAEQFRSLGLSEPSGAEGYFQHVPLVRIEPATSGVFITGRDTLRNQEALVPVSADTVDYAGESVFAGYGIVDPAAGIDDYQGKNVEGKVVIAHFGAPPTYEGPYSDIMPDGRMAKAQLAAERGAVALIELMKDSTPPGWARYSAYMSRSGYQLETRSLTFPSFIAYDPDGTLAKRLRSENTPVQLASTGRSRRAVVGKNVAGIIKGSDPELADEYIVLTAHYDHIGIGQPAGTPPDSIYNGARDNGMGTVALLAAARSFANSPAGRSIMVLAVTAEEVGLLGSRYYTDSPLIPLSKTVFVLNTDGAGYTDSTAISVIGLERTGAAHHIRQAASDIGLGVIEEPAPDQNLFNRSDNAPFARKGVPAPTLSPGFHSFDAELGKYYHTPADEVGRGFNFDYLYRYAATFARAARLIADDPESPKWEPGDPYEEAGRKLYGW